jgi:hypothetical protein
MKYDVYLSISLLLSRMAEILNGHRNNRITNKDGYKLTEMTHIRHLVN